MSFNISDLYQQFFKSFKNAFPNISVQNAQVKANEEWKEVKERFKNDKKGFADFIQQRMNIKTSSKKLLFWVTLQKQLY